MTVVADNVGGSGDDGAFNELVVVGGGLKEIEVLGGIDGLDVCSVGNVL
jgi:hypothetical protein